MKKEIIRFTYLDYEKGFNLVDYIKTISESPKVINIYAKIIDNNYHSNKFIVDSVICDFDLLNNSFPNSTINIIGDILHICQFEIVY